MTRRRQCRHTSVLTYTYAYVYVPTTTGIPPQEGVTRVPGQHRCDRCGEVAWLGEAHDTPEVMVEIRAAEIAARCNDDDWGVDEREHDGWIRAACDSLSPETSCLSYAADASDEWWHAGYLARAIATHEESQ